MLQLSLDLSDSISDFSHVYSSEPSTASLQDFTSMPSGGLSDLVSGDGGDDTMALPGQISIGTLASSNNSVITSTLDLPILGPYTHSQLVYDFSKLLQTPSSGDLPKTEFVRKEDKGESPYPKNFSHSPMELQKEFPGMSARIQASLNTHY